MRGSAHAAARSARCDPSRPAEDRVDALTVVPRSQPGQPAPGRLGVAARRGCQPAGPKSYANLVGALTNRSCRTTFWTEAPTLVDAIMSYCHGTNSEKVAFQGAPAPVLAAFRQEFRRIANANRNLVLSAEVSLMLSPAVRRALSPSTVGTTATFRAPAGPRLPRWQRRRGSRAIGAAKRSSRSV